MNNDLLDQLALETGGSHFPAVFGHYQRDYILNVLSEIYHVYKTCEDKADWPEEYLGIDLWDDIVKHFKLDNYEIDKVVEKST